MNDPFAQYRRKSPALVAETAPPKIERAYEAFNAKDKVERLRIRRANAPTRSPAYAYLLDVVYDGEFGTNFALVYTFMIVTVRGRNLQSLVTAVEMGTGDFIQEFDADRWDKPKDSTAVFIQSIEVVIKEGGPPIADSDGDASAKSRSGKPH